MIDNKIIHSKETGQEFEFSHFGYPKDKEYILGKDGRIVQHTFGEWQTPWGIRTILRLVKPKSPFSKYGFTMIDPQGERLHIMKSHEPGNVLFSVHAPISGNVRVAPGGLKLIRDSIDKHLKSLEDDSLDGLTEKYLGLREQIREQIKETGYE